MSTGGPGSGLGSGMGGVGTGSIGGVGSGYTRTGHDVEEQNDQRLEGLLGKVKILKDVRLSALARVAGRRFMGNGQRRS
jgi:hypothetical protein